MALTPVVRARHTLAMSMLNGWHLERGRVALPVFFRATQATGDDEQLTSGWVPSHPCCHPIDVMARMKVPGFRKIVQKKLETLSRLAEV